MHSEAPPLPFHKGPHSKVWVLLRLKSAGCSAPVAVKCYEEAAKFEILKEVDMLSRLHHPNIVKIVDVASVNQVASMITEHRGINLHEVIQKQKRKHSGAAPVKCWFGQLIQQLLCGMQYVHSQNVIHTDLKPANMVVDDCGVLRLIDFGCACVDLPGHRRVYRFEDVRQKGLLYGTLPYKAIELLLGDFFFGKAVDVWAIGCIMFEVTVLEPLFNFGSDTNAVDVLRGCIAYLGQKDKLGCLGHLAKWDPVYAQTQPAVADFWTRINTAGALGADVGRIAIKLLNIDKKERPSIEGCNALWDAF